MISEEEINQELHVMSEVCKLVKDLPLESLQRVSAHLRNWAEWRSTDVPKKIQEEERNIRMYEEELFKSKGKLALLRGQNENHQAEK